jgi:hypothetical protein
MYKKRNKKDKVNFGILDVKKLTIDTPQEEALLAMQYNLLNPKDPALYDCITYLDEVVLLCLLKDVQVTFNPNEAEYRIDGEIVSASIDKLIEKGFVDSETLKPDFKTLKRVYISHLFVVDENFAAIRHKAFMDYWLIDELEACRSKWKSADVIYTLRRGLISLGKHSERITFCTITHISTHKPKKHKIKKPSLVFDYNLELLESITSVVLKEIQAQLTKE